MSRASSRATDSSGLDGHAGTPVAAEERATERRAPVRNAIVLMGSLLILWQIAYWIVGDVALRSPWQTLRYTALTLTHTNLFWVHLANTLQAFGLALLIAVALGLLIGFALGLHRLSGEAMEPMLVALYSIPKITLYPILLLAFGLGMSAKVAFGAIHGIIPIALFTLNAVRGIKPILLKTGRVLKLDSTMMVRSILFPAAVPEIFTGLRVGFSLTLIGTVLGEMFAAQHGLGYLLMNAIGLYNIDVIMSVTFLLVVFAAGVNAVLLAIDRRLHFRG
jgi:NitT/TauT family transport system permease protein